MKPSDLQVQAADMEPDLYDSSGPRENKVRKIIGDFPPGQKILDVGCANGAMLAPFVKQHELHGVDISAPMLSSAARAGFKTVLVDLEVNPLPYPDKTFDVLFCGENIEHYVNTDWVLSELNRVLKPGGRLVFTFPNIRTPVGVAMLIFADLPPMFAARYRASHFRDFTVRLAKWALTNHSFSVDRCIRSSFFIPKLGDCGAWLAEWIPSWSSTVIVLGTKLKDSAYDPKTVLGELP